MATTIAPDGPPRTLEIGGATWHILRIGRCLFSPFLTKEVILKQMVTWFDATWVARRPSEATSSEKTALVAYPVMYCHASGEQVFLTPELAAEIDNVTAEKAGVEASELDREETQLLKFGEADMRVPIVPKQAGLAPAGYVAPVFKKVAKNNGVNDDNDNDDDDEEPKKAKSKSKDAKKTTVEKEKELVSCAWFLGPLTRTGDCSWTPSIAVAIKTPAAGASAAPKKRPAVEDTVDAGASAPKKKKAADAEAKPVAKPPAKEASKPAAKPVAKTIAKPVGKPAAKSAPAKEAPKAAATKPMAVLVPHDMFAPPPRGNGAQPHTQNCNESAGDSLFVFKKGDHEENVRKFLAYMVTSPEAPEETRALVKFLAGAARKKPDAIKDNLFRVLGMPPGAWNTDGLTHAVQSLNDREQERARASFAAMRAVFAELLTFKAAKKIDASEW